MYCVDCVDVINEESDLYMSITVQSVGRLQAVSTGHYLYIRLILSTISLCLNIIIYIGVTSNMYMY